MSRQAVHYRKMARFQHNVFVRCLLYLSHISIAINIFKKMNP